MFGPVVRLALRSSPSAWCPARSGRSPAAGGGYASSADRSGARHWGRSCEGTGGRAPDRSSGAAHGPVDAGNGRHGSARAPRPFSGTENALLRFQSEQGRVDFPWTVATRLAIRYPAATLEIPPAAVWRPVPPTPLGEPVPPAVFGAARRRRRRRRVRRRKTFYCSLPQGSRSRWSRSPFVLLGCAGKRHQGKAGRHRIREAQTHVPPLPPRGIGCRGAVSAGSLAKR
jgi:hypothetical protein